MSIELRDELEKEEMSEIEKAVIGLMLYMKTELLKSMSAYFGSQKYSNSQILNAVATEWNAIAQRPKVQKLLSQIDKRLRRVSEVAVKNLIEKELQIDYSTEDIQELVTRSGDFSKERMYNVILGSVTMYLTAIRRSLERGASYRAIQNSVGEVFNGRREDETTRPQRIAQDQFFITYGDARYVTALEIARRYTMYKRAVTRGDNRVRPTHTEDEAVGYIGINSLYPSGSYTKPQEHNCRCHQEYTMIVPVVEAGMSKEEYIHWKNHYEKKHDNMVCSYKNGKMIVERIHNHHGRNRNEIERLP